MTRTVVDVHDTSRIAVKNRSIQKDVKRLRELTAAEIGSSAGQEPINRATCESVACMATSTSGSLG